MKKAAALALLFCVLFTFAAAANAEEPDFRTNAVSELYSAEGHYTDSVGNSELYCFHVPQLTADTEAAKAINAEIEERFGDYVASQLKNMQGGHSLWCRRAEWHPYWNGNRLFLLVSAELEGDSMDYEAYGYDYEKQCRVTNEMVLEQLGITEEDYLENLREKVQFMFEDLWRRIRSEEREQIYQDALEKTLAWTNMERTLYLDGFGEPVTIVKIVTIAGAGWRYYLATPFAYG